MKNMDELYYQQKIFRFRPLCITRKSFFPLLILMIVNISAVFMPLNGQGLYPPEIAKWIESGVIRTIQNDFSGAESTFQKLIDELPAEPCGYFYLGATVQAEMLDREDFSRLAEFNAAMDTTIDLAKSMRKKDPANLRGWFFEGSAYLYRSFMDNKRKKMWGAYRNASKGVNRLEKALALDTTFYDAYLGVGSYKYWKSSKAKALAWLPFVADDREKGVRMVHKAIEKGQFVRLVAGDQLAWMLLDFGRADEALTLAERNHRQFPNSRFFMWTLVEIYLKNQQFEQALQLYKELLTILRKQPFNNHYNEMNCLLHIAEIYYEQGDFLEAEQHLNELLQLELSEEISKRSKSKRKRAATLRKRCIKELARVD